MTSLSFSFSSFFFFVALGAQIYSFAAAGHFSRRAAHATRLIAAQIILS